MTQSYLSLFHRHLSEEVARELLAFLYRLIDDIQYFQYAQQQQEQRDLVEKLDDEDDFPPF